MIKLKPHSFIIHGSDPHHDVEVLIAAAAVGSLLLLLLLCAHPAGHPGDISCRGSDAAGHSICHCAGSRGCNQQVRQAALCTQCGSVSQHLTCQ